MIPFKLRTYYPHVSTYQGKEIRSREELTVADDL